MRAKIRHRHEPAWAVILSVGVDEVEAVFDEPQRAVTPGQAAVFMTEMKWLAGDG